MATWPACPFVPHSSVRLGDAVFSGDFADDTTFAPPTLFSIVCDGEELHAATMTATTSINARLIIVPLPLLPLLCLLVLCLLGERTITLRECAFEAFLAARLHPVFYGVGLMRDHVDVGGRLLGRANPDDIE